MRQYSFEKLEVWQLARGLAKRVYLITSDYPPEEKFGLKNQLRRAVISISSNIAEGTSRSSRKEKARFIEISYGSLMELLNQLILSVDLNYVKQEELDLMRSDIEELSNKLNSLRKSYLNY